MLGFGKLGWIGQGVLKRGVQSFSRQEFVWKSVWGAASGHTRQLDTSPHHGDIKICSKSVSWVCFCMICANRNHMKTVTKRYNHFEPPKNALSSREFL